MGILDYLSPLKTGRKILELEIALLGKYVYENLSTEEEKERIRDFVDSGLETGGFGDKTMESVDEKVRYLLVGLTMKKLGLDHGMLKGIKIFVKNPFAIEKYSKALTDAAARGVRKKFGLDVSF